MGLLIVAILCHRVAAQVTLSVTSKRKSAFSQVAVFLRAIISMASGKTYIMISNLHETYGASHFEKCCKVVGSIGIERFGLEKCGRALVCSLPGSSSRSVVLLRFAARSYDVIQDYAPIPRLTDVLQLFGRCCFIYLAAKEKDAGAW